VEINVIQCQLSSPPPSNSLFPIGSQNATVLPASSYSAVGHPFLIAVFHRLADLRTPTSMASLRESLLESPEEERSTKESLRILNVNYPINPCPPLQIIPRPPIGHRQTSAKPEHLAIQFCITNFTTSTADTPHIHRNDGFQRTRVPREHDEDARCLCKLSPLPLDPRWRLG